MISDIYSARTVISVYESHLSIQWRTCSWVHPHTNKFVLIHTSCLQFGEEPQTHRYNCAPPDRGDRCRLRQEDAPQESRWGMYCARRARGTPQLPDPELRWPAISCLSVLNNKSQPFDSTPTPSSSETNPRQSFSDTLAICLSCINMPIHTPQ